MVFGSKKKSQQSKESVKRNKKSQQSKEVFTAVNQSKEAVSNIKSTTGSSAKDKDKDEKPKDAKTETEGGMLKVMAKALTHNHWFHGLMPRDEIEDLLKSEGDFLMRKTEVERKPRYAISVCRKGAIKHILLSYKNGMWSLRDCKKQTLTELIKTHVEEKIPVMSDGTLLINGVSRPEFYILHEHVDLKKKLGAGAFGEVYVGTWKKSDSETLEVAVKKLKGMMHKKERIEFVREAKLMRRFDHQNIVKVYGVAPQEEPMLIILEFANGGSLQGKLRSSAEITSDQLLGYCKDGARGMCYLAGRQVIHRDIAARNCLLGKNDELKISDFGLSIADRSIVKLDKLKAMPIKWLSPETLKKGEFTKKTDVWSFGVLMWEIFTRCKTDPFPGDTNQEAKKKILSGKIPLKPPEDTPAIAATVMDMCFIQDPKDRPEFEAIFKLLAPTEKPPITEENMFETYAA